MIELILTSLWLGILTSISPCPLATNIAATTSVGEAIGSPLKVLFSGIFYTLGRVALYLILGVALSYSISSIPFVSSFLQNHMWIFLSPLLIIAGLIVLDIIKISLPAIGFFKGGKKSLNQKGLVGKFFLGFVFALALCPVSAALFLGNLTQTRGSIIGLIFFGIGTGLPVLILSFLISSGVKNISAYYNKISLFEKYARKLTGWVFILAGLYLLFDNINLEFNMFENFGNFIAFNLFGLEASSKAGKAVQFFMMDIAKIMILVTIIMFVVSFFREGLDNNKIKNYIESKPKWLAYIIAVLLGAVTPFCSCSSIPLFIGFMEAGISFGVVMAFLITSPMINEVAVPIFATAVGWEITTLYVISGMAVGILGGVLLEKLGLEKYVIRNNFSKEKSSGCGCSSKDKDEKSISEDKKEKANKESCCSKPVVTYKEETCCSDKKPEKSTGCGCSTSKNFSIGFNVGHRSKAAFKYTKDLMKKIAPYVVIGIGLGAWIHGYVPESFFMKYAGKGNFFAVPFAVLAGIPMYTDAVGIIPVAKALLSKSVPIGTVMAMMMSVVAISLPEMIILRKVLKVRLIAYFAILLFFAFNIVGFLFNFIYG